MLAAGILRLAKITVMAILVILLFIGTDWAVDAQMLSGASDEQSIVDPQNEARGMLLDAFEGG